jgi:lipopolysaccharide transport system ATP-binding protein
MSDIALRMEHVYKKFRKGEVYNSLRDLVPALTGRMFRQQELSEQDKREFWALQDLSFEVRHGESLGIIGRNGAGKSTALKILSRIMNPTKGRMVVQGRLSALIEVSAGFHPDLTGRENIFLNGAILGMSKREIESKLDQIIAFSGIEEFIDTPVKRYSSGMYARLGFSVAAHVDPEVLIVDEVLSVGDYAFQQKCIERVKEVLRSGAAVLFVSHNLKSVAEFCQRCLLLEKGRTIMLGPAPEVVSTYLSRAVTEDPKDVASSAVLIASVAVRNRVGNCTRFQSGEKAWVDIEVSARERCTKLSVSLIILDDSLNTVFDISTERLGLENFSLEQGSLYSCTFELDLNMARGIYHVSVLVKRYDTKSEYIRRVSEATLYIISRDEVRGSVNCFPRVIRQEICPKK